MSSCTAAAFASWQGPDWLARLLLCPPSWLNPALAVVAGVVGLVALVRLRQRGWELELATQRSMLTIAATVGAVLVATLVLVDHEGTTYAEDVIFGTLLGFVGVQVGRWPVGGQIATVFERPEERLLLGWAAVAALAVVATAIGSSSSGLRLGRWWLLVLAGVMASYNARELADR